MSSNKQKEYFLVLFIAVIIATGGYLVSRAHTKIETLIPQEQLVLDEQDFLITCEKGVLNIGSSTREDALAVFPQGKTLGMSTIYKPVSPDCLLTFDKDEAVLQKFHIYSAALSTYRGVKVGDPFSLVSEKYGPNYSSVSQAGKTQDFDAIYGVGSNIIFQVREAKVKTIILQKE